MCTSFFSFLSSFTLSLSLSLVRPLPSPPRSANITIGRLGALLAYAYHLCKHYIKTNARVNLVVTFLGVVTTWLFRFLIKAKFYEWLESMGGWVRQYYTLVYLRNFC